MTPPETAPASTPAGQAVPQAGNATDPPEDASSQVSSIPGVARALSQEKLYSAALDTLRQRSDITAKAIAGLGTTAIGGLGIAKLTDIWPPGEPDWAIASLVAGFLAMAVGVIMLARRVWHAQQPIVIGSERLVEDLDPTEQCLADRIAGEVAHFRDVESLRAYQARGERFERVGSRLKLVDAELAHRLLEEAQVILAEVGEARMRTVYAVVRRRASNAFHSIASVALALLIAAGFYMAGISADRLDSERTGQIEFAKNCAVAIGTPNIENSDLPGPCREGAPVPPQPNTPAPETTTTTTTTSPPSAATTATTGSSAP